MSKYFVNRRVQELMLCDVLRVQEMTRRLK